MRLLDRPAPACLLVIGTLVLLDPTALRAEVRTIAASGEYRMGDNDTRSDAKRLALLDAKRLALEQAGTYLEGVTEVKNLQVSRDEIRSYTAGIVEVKEQTTKTVMEGETTVVRVDVTVQVDTAVVARQIDVLRRNEHARDELVQARQEADRLRQEVEAKTKELASLKSKSGAEPLLREREQAFARLDAQDLVLRASRTVGQRGGFLDGEPLPEQERSDMKAMLKQAVLLDPGNAKAHVGLGYLLQEEGNGQAAVREFREALRLNPKLARAHAGLGRALLADGRRAEARREFQLFLDTVQPTPGNQRLIEKVRHKLRDMDGQPVRSPRPDPPRRPDGPSRRPRDQER